MKPLSCDTLPRPIIGLGLISILSILAAILVLSLTPPVSRDALVHHLALPKLYLEFGGMVELPCFLHSYYPMNLDLLYGLGLLTGSDIFPKFIHGFFGLLTGGLIFCHLKKRIGSHWALMGCLLLYCVPVVIKLSTIVYVDLGVMFFSTAALLSAFSWIRSGFNRKYIVLSGVFCGLAMGTKYNGLGTLLLILSLLPLAHWIAGVSWKKIGEAGLIVLVVSMVVFSPWAIRNFHWTGNPVYPLFQQFTLSESSHGACDIAPSLPSTDQRYHVFSRRQGLYGETLTDVLLLPLRIFFQGKDDDFQYFDGKLCVFLLVLPMFAFWGRGPEDRLLSFEKKSLLLFSVGFFCIVFFFRVMRIRYFIPSVLCLVILSVYGLRNLFNLAVSGSHLNTRRLSWVLIGILSVHTLVQTATYTHGLFLKYKPLAYLSGAVSRDAYISHFRHEYPVFQYTNAHLKKDAKILFFYVGQRGYYCNRPYIPDNGGNLLTLFEKIKDGDRPPEISSWLKNHGVTHLMMHRGLVKDRLYEDLDVDGRKVFLAFLNKNTQQVYAYKAFALYALQ